MFEAPLTFTEAEAMLRRNMLREWKARYGWARWMVAAKERAKIEIAYFVVRRQGAPYYNELAG